MIQFNKPELLNGEQLISELKAIGVMVNDKTSPLIDGNGNFWLDISTQDQTKAESIVNAHVGVDNSAEIEAQRQAILDRIGLSADELKLILG
jgi:hypothetical protein